MLTKNLLSSTFARAAGVALAVGLAFGAAPAAATPTLRFSTDLGATWTTVADNGAGDLAVAAGAVAVTGSSLPWVFNFDVGLTKPILGSSLHPNMDLAYTAVSTAAGTLIVEFSEDNFLASPGQFLAFIGGTAAVDRAGSTTSFETFIDPTNTLFGTGSGAFTQFVTGAGAFSDAQSKLYNGGIPYSLTLRVGISHNGASNSSGDAQLIVPEPGTVALLGLGLLGLAGVARRRRQS